VSAAVGLLVQADAGAAPPDIVATAPVLTPPPPALTAVPLAPALTPVPPAMTSLPTAPVLTPPPPHEATAPAPRERERRVCTDPNNVPFSNAPEQGFENPIARLAAKPSSRTRRASAAADPVTCWGPRSRESARCCPL